MSRAKHRKSERSNCGLWCLCICHDMGGGSAHPGRRCKSLTEEEKRMEVASLIPNK